MDNGKLSARDVHAPKTIGQASGDATHIPNFGTLASKVHPRRQSGDVHILDLSPDVHVPEDNSLATKDGPPFPKDGSAAHTNVGRVAINGIPVSTNVIQSLLDGTPVGKDDIEVPTSSGANVTSQVLMNAVALRKIIDEIAVNDIPVPDSKGSVDEAIRGPGDGSPGFVHTDKLHVDDSRMFRGDSDEDKIDVGSGESDTASDDGGPRTDDAVYYDDRSNDDEYRETSNGQAPWNGSHSTGSDVQGTENGHKLSVGDGGASGSDGQSTVTGDQSSGTIDQSSAIGEQSSGTDGQSSGTIDQSSVTGDQSSGTGVQSTGTGDQSLVNNGHALINDGGSLGNDGQAPVAVGQGYRDVPHHDDQRTVVHVATAFHPVAKQKLKSKNIASSHDGRVPGSDNLILPARSRHRGEQAEGQSNDEPHVSGSTELSEDANSREEGSEELNEDAESQEVSVVSTAERSREKMLSTIVGVVVLAFFFMLAGMLFALVLSRIE